MRVFHGKQRALPGIAGAVIAFNVQVNAVLVALLSKVVCCSASARNDDGAFQLLARQVGSPRTYFLTQDYVYAPSKLSFAGFKILPSASFPIKIDEDAFYFVAVPTVAAVTALYFARVLPLRIDARLFDVGDVLGRIAINKEVDFKAGKKALKDALKKPFQAGHVRAVLNAVSQGRRSESKSMQFIAVVNEIPRSSRNGSATIMQWLCVFGATSAAESIVKAS